MKIQVRKEHIEHAIKKDSHECMIADAIHKTVPNAGYVIVDLQSIRYSNLATGKRYIYLTPPVAQKAILKFDKGESVKPFTFTAQRPIIRTMRVRQKLTLKKRNRKTEKKSDRKMPSRERQFGLRKFVE